MDGKAIVLCEGSFDTDYGKTAHGLVRHTERYDVVAVIDSNVAGRDAGEFLDGRPNGIPVVASLDEAGDADYLVVGMATDGGHLPASCRQVIAEALRRGLNVDSGLHVFLGEDPEFAALASEAGAAIRDVRRPPPRGELHFFSGEIASVRAKRIAVLGTDCAIGKRTTAVRLAAGLREAGVQTELVGTGQTSWLQGVRYGVLLDSLVNDFVGGELEHAVVRADREASPEVIVIEGQSALTHPAGSGGFEILASTRPQGVILQHAPGRPTHSGYPDYPILPPEVHIAAMESLFGTRVVGLGLNSEGLERGRIPSIAAELSARYGLPCCDPLSQGVSPLVEAVRSL